MKIYKFTATLKKIIFLLVIIFMITIIFVASILAKRYNSNVLHGLEIVAKDNSGASISFDLKEEFERDFPEMKMAIYNKVEMSIKEKYSVENSVVYGADSEFFQVNKYPVLEGSYLFQSDIRAYNGYVVISRDLSYDLFNTVDVLGKDIEINNTNFSIIGVIESSRLLPWNPLYKEERLVVMPSYDFSKIANENGGISATILSTEKVDQSIVESWLEDKGLQLWHYEMKSNGKSNMVFRKNLSAVLFILGATVIVFILFILYAQIIDGLQVIDKWNKEMYPKEWFKYRRKQMIYSLAKIGLLSGIMVLIWWVITFDFYFDIYYDGSHSISSFREFVLWIIETQKYTLEDKRTSMSWTIDLLNRLRNYSLIGLMVMIYPNIIKGLKKIHVKVVLGSE